ncbi:MAG: sulfite exporter TauE/SafE family protein [Bacteroidetes bacterium]|nr:sulfite exporter TauE/SafE family protein [Bacteroidota bacterium]MCL5026898.1 sulfite exporter TauE/SafE family protein [Chloroflexota bacterium]
MGVARFGGQASDYAWRKAKTVLEFFLVIFVGAVAAGVVGALAGLGGGILIVPLLTVGFGVDIRYAIGASIVSVIATSSGAAAAYIRDQITNLRVGTFLQLATTSGAIVGALIAGLVNTEALYIVFGLALASSAIPLIVKIGQELPEGVVADSWSRRLNLGSSYYDAVLGRQVDYEATRVPLGLGLMWVAGVLSGLLGIGSGAFKVLAMDMGMRLPMKVSTTTSNFMIGVTAAASAGIYFSRGDIHPLIVAPIALGVLLGAALGTRLLVRLRNTTLRKVFVPVLLIVAAEMVLRGMGVRT